MILGLSLNLVKSTAEGRSLTENHANQRRH